jgi:tRNA-binding protein
VKEITWEDFEKIDIRVGTILQAGILEGARKAAYKLQIDFGEQMGIKRCSAQITTLYNAEELTGVQVIAIVNFPPKQIGTFFSECLVLGIYDENNNVVLLQPERKLSNGLKIG